MSLLADYCSFCNTRMIHPAMGLYICPNEKCEFKFMFHPECKGKTIEVIHKSKLEV